VMSRQSSEETFFDELVAAIEEAEISLVAPSRLKSKVYSTLVLRQRESGPLLSISETKANARGLCVFENLVEIAPLNEKVKSLNYCRVCHARVLAENIEDAPIYWHGCPYVDFQNR
jgi:hypothetical protein